MSNALCESLSQPIGSDPLSWAGVTSPSAMAQTPVMEPLVFGAYFDLLAAEHLPASDLCASRVTTQDAVEWLGRRLSGQTLSPTTRQVLGDGAPPLVSTLSADFYSPIEMARWKRWLDMEPDNAMSLSGLQADDFSRALDKVQRALAALAVSAPELHAEIVIITREILVLRPDGAQRMSFRGASSFALWGASAFNQLVHEHWADYLKTLVHESAHTLLFALAREEPLVLNDSSERYGSPLRDDLRPMDGIFHAAFVSAREAYALDKYQDFLDLQSDAESKVLATKIEAELSASVCAFWDCCDEIEQDGLLSPLGQDILKDTTAWVSSRFQVEDLSSGPQ
jgi:HEXXH motif-containing protein